MKSPTFRAVRNEANPEKGPMAKEKLESEGGSGFVWYVISITLHLAYFRRLSYNGYFRSPTAAMW